MYLDTGGTTSALNFASNFDQALPQRMLISCHYLSWAFIAIGFHLRLPCFERRASNKTFAFEGLVGTRTGNFASRILQISSICNLGDLNLHLRNCRSFVNLIFWRCICISVSKLFAITKTKKRLTPLNVLSSPPIFFCFEEDVPRYKRALLIETTWKE